MKLVDFEFIGEGANGRVFRCKDELGRDLAVKFFTNSFDPVSRQVEEHAIGLARIRHENVVGIVAVERLVHPEKASGSPPEMALVMEFVPGTSFGTWLGLPNKSLEDLRTFVNGILSGLNAFHEAGWAHCDLHAGNVKILGGKPKLIDPMAHDPHAVLTTALNADRQGRDLRDARHLIHEAMRAFNVPMSGLRHFGDPGGDFSTITAIRQQFETAMRSASAETVTALSVPPLPQTTSIYDQCREAQRMGDVVAWQETRKIVIRDAVVSFDRLRESYKNGISNAGDADELVARGLGELEPILSMLLALGELDLPHARRDFAMLERIVLAEWPRAGQTLVTEAPWAIAFAITQLVGAAATTNANGSGLIELFNLRVPPSPGANTVVAIWQSKALMGWPTTLGRKSDGAWKWLLGQYASVPVLRRVFPTETDFRVALYAFNLLACVRTVRMEKAGTETRFTTHDGISGHAVPPHWVTLRPSELGQVWRTLQSAPISTYLTTQGVSKADVLHERWLDFVRWSVDFWSSSHHVDIHFLPEWVLTSPIV